MALRKRERISAAAWLGLLALAIQVLLPTLLAFEISIAGAEGATGLFSDCAYGHRHVAAQQNGGGKPSDTPRHDDGSADPCPICIALLASSSFMVPSDITLCVPAGAPIEAPSAIEAAAPTTSVAAAYRSRAPPIV
jgi:hypothetical protein